MKFLIKPVQKIYDVDEEVLVVVALVSLNRFFNDNFDVFALVIPIAVVVVVVIDNPLLALEEEALEPLPNEPEILEVVVAVVAGELVVVVIAVLELAVAIAGETSVVVVLVKEPDQPKPEDDEELELLVVKSPRFSPRYPQTAQILLLFSGLNLFLGKSIRRKVRNPLISLHKSSVASLGTSQYFKSKISRAEQFFVAMRA